MTEQGTKGTGSGGFESKWGARCEGRGSVLFPGWNCKNAFLPGPQCKQNGLFYLIEWPLCIWTNRSIWWLALFIICWRKLSVTRSDDLFLWPICWNMKITLLFGTLIFPSIILLHLLLTVMEGWMLTYRWCCDQDSSLKWGRGNL